MLRCGRRGVNYRYGFG